MAIFRGKEFESLAAGAHGQQWSEVTHDKPRKASIESDFVIPVLQTITSGFFIGAAVQVTAYIIGFPKPFYTGMVCALCYDACMLPRFYAYARSTLWESRRAVGAASQGVTASREAQRDELTVYVSAPGEGGFVNTTIHKMATSAETLRTIAQLEALSVRALMDSGIPQNESARLVSELEQCGFAYRDATNKPACWTAAGNALRRQLTG